MTAPLRARTPEACILALFACLGESLQPARG